MARVVVLASLALAAYLNDQGKDLAGGHPPFHRAGLLGWDSAYYRDIAAHGYAELPVDARRFFPLMPVLVRVLGLGHAAGPVLLVVVNVLALVYGVVLLRLIRVEGWDPDVGRGSVWLLALAAPAFVLVMGYSEALAGLLSVLVFLGLRTGRFEGAAVAGFLVGLSRPSGVLLAAPALIEAIRQRERPLWARITAVVAPLAGAAVYLGYIGIRFGDALQPLRIQQDPQHHGHAGNPIKTIVDSARGLTEGRVGTGLHVPWLVLFVVLLVVMARRLPASYTVWAGLTLLSALAGTNLDSLERYAWGAFPFVVLGAVLIAGRRTAWNVVLVLAAASLTGYSVLAFLGLYVP